MEPRLTPRQRTPRAFTLIELLVVIAIIAILAAILFPVFGVVREQARQSSTISNMHAIYQGATLFNADEGHYPSVLFGYAEAPDAALGTMSPPRPPQHPATTADLGTPYNVTAMDQVKEYFATNLGAAQEGLNRGYLYPEQVKDFSAFTCPDNLVLDKRATNTPMTQVYYPHNALNGLADTVVTWATTGTPDSKGCSTTADRDLPDSSYIGQPKYYYKMDSMDIGPRLDPNGNVLYNADHTPMYELHYSPDWSHELGQNCEPLDSNNGGQIDITQMKYKNPPTDRTVMTYVTDHVATAGSSKALVLLLSGTVKKMDVNAAAHRLPLNYIP